MEKLKSTTKKKIQKSSKIPVYKMTEGGRKLKKYTSISEAALVNGVDPSSISKATRGIRRMAGGFVWQVA